MITGPKSLLGVGARLRDRSLKWAPTIVLIASLVASLVLATLWADATGRIADGRFSAAVREQAGELDSRVGQVADLVSGTAALSVTTDDLDAVRFRRYLNSLAAGRALAAQYRGLRSLALVDATTTEVLLAEPASTGATLRGENLSSYEVLGEALAQSRDLGLTAVSGRMTPVLTDRTGAQVAVAQPVYRTQAASAPTATIERRRDEIERWVVAFVNVSDLIAEVGGDTDQGVGVVVADGPTGEPLGAEPAGFTSEDRVDRHRTVLLSLPGRTWRLGFAQRPGFVSRFERNQFWFALAPGALLALALFALARVLATQRARALAMVEEATAQLAQANADLERSNRELREFAGMVSHDLKSPLTTVRGFLEVLKARYPERLEGQPGEMVDRSLRGVARMTALIDDLLAYTKVGHTPAELEDVSLQAVLDSVLESLDRAITDSGASVHAGPLPDVRGDPRQLGLVLQNLIGNAIKFTHPDVLPEVRVDADRDGDRWRIVVADNGIGIPKDEREAVMLAFHRAGRAGYSGTGLGLAIVDKVVKAHGGTVTITESDLGGTAISFDLPSTEAGSSGPDRRGRRGRAGGGAPDQVAGDRGDVVDPAHRHRVSE